MIELQDVQRTYRKGTEQIHALAGVSLTITRGEFVAVVGPVSGRGLPGQCSLATGSRTRTGISRSVFV